MNLKRYLKSENFYFTILTVVLFLSSIAGNHINIFFTKLINVKSGSFFKIYFKYLLLTIILILICLFFILTLKEKSNKKTIKNFTCFFNIFFIFIFSFYIIVYYIYFKPLSFKEFGLFFLNQEEKRKIKWLILEITDEYKAYSYNKIKYNSILKGYSTKQSIKLINKLKNISKVNIFKDFKLNTSSFKCIINLYISDFHLLRKGDLIFVKVGNIKNLIEYNSIFLDRNNYFYIFRKKNSKLLNLFIFQFRGFVYNVLVKNISEFNRNFFYSLITGDKFFLDNKLIEIYRANSTSHILALSGLHLGILISIFFFIFKLIFKEKKIIFLVISPVILFYIILTDYQISIIRSFIMFLFVFITINSKYKINPVKLIFTISLTIFYIMTDQFLNISFILSITAIYGIFCIYPVLKIFFKLILERTGVLLFREISLIKSLLNYNLFRILKKYFEINFIRKIFLPFLLSLSISIFQFFLLIYFFGKNNFSGFLINPFVIFIITLAVYFILCGLGLNLLIFLLNLSFNIKRFYLFSYISDYFNRFLINVGDSLFYINHLINIWFYKNFKNFTIEINSKSYIFILFVIIIYIMFNYFYFFIYKEKKLN